MDNESFSEYEWSLTQSIKRFWYICTKLVPPFLAFHFSRHNSHSVKFQTAIKQIRVAFQELGTTFIKLGQMLSSRPDIVGPELSDELRNLLDNQPSLSFSTIKKTVESELKGNLSNIFKEFNEKPIATASIGQVHMAKLMSGEQVAVKVQRYGLVKLVERDLVLFKRLVHLLDALVGSKGLRFEYLYKEFYEWIMTELDFRTEGRRADTFRHNMEGIEYVVVPRVYWQYTTNKVLTTSFIEGLTLNAIFDKMHKLKITTIDELKLPFALDGKKVAQHIIGGLFKQMFVDKFFHADLHPANLIIQKHNKIAFIDFGIIGILDTVEHTKMLLLLLALIDNDPQALIKVMISFSAEPFTPVQKKTLYQQFSRELHQIHGGLIGKVSLSHFITSLLSLSKKYNITWSSGIILVAKTISQIDSIAFQFGLKMSVIELIRPEMEKQIAECFSNKISKEMVFRETLELIEAGKHLPESITELEGLIGDDVRLRLGEETGEKGLSLVNIMLVMLVCISATYILIQSNLIGELGYKNWFVTGFPLILFFTISKMVSRR